MGRIVLTAYLSHGAPTSLVERTRIHDVYEKLGKALGKLEVDSVVISSPHYFSRGAFQVESRNDIPCIRDYYGFPDELYKFSYEAKNNFTLASEIVSQSTRAGLSASESQSWGLDHGAWLPLYFMFPKQDVKVVPVSISSASPETHFRFGESIRRAVENVSSRVAVIGTGSPVHRLDLIRYGYYGQEKFEPGQEFDEKVIATIASRDVSKILRIPKEFPSLYQDAQPEGDLNPLYIALGASPAEELVGETILHEFMYYGVSLISTILSAGIAARELLPKAEAH